MYLFRGGRLIGMKKSTADVEQGKLASELGTEEKTRAIDDSETLDQALPRSSKQ